VVNTKRNETSGKECEIHNEPRTNKRVRQQNSIHQDRGEIDHDIRKATLKRIRERAEVQQRAYAEDRQTRVELHKSITEQSTELRAELEQNSIKLSREYATVTEQSRELINGAKEITQESESSVQLSNELNKTTTARERIVNTIRNFIDGIKEFGTELKERFQSVIQQSEETTRTAKRYGEKLREDFNNVAAAEEIAEHLREEQQLEQTHYMHYR
jgi:uncharacterized phage infection (PIP) family protein YhgE